jgi:hypothetical protein
MKNYSALLIFAIALTVGTKSFAGSGKEVNEKVIKSFKQTFPFAEKTDWQEFSDRYVVHFEEASILTVVDYDKEGNFLNSKRYYKEDNLPVNILCRIRKKYADKKIFMVTEVATESSIDYYIKMEDNQSWITVKSDASGGMEVVEKYKKQA